MWHGDVLITLPSALNMIETFDSKGCEHKCQGVIQPLEEIRRAPARAQDSSHPIVIERDAHLSMDIDEIVER